MDRKVDDDGKRELADVFRRHSADLFRHACFLLQGDSQRARDLVQDVFHAATWHWLLFLAYDEEHRVRWLFRVLHNKYVDVIRARTREPEVELPERDWAAPDDTAGQALCGVTLDKCWAVIRQMPPVRHKVAVLCWSAGWSTPEVAAYLGIAPATVRVHLRNARQELLDVVGPDLPFGETRGAGGE